MRFSLAFLALLALALPALAEDGFELGLERAAVYQAIIRGKNVGLVVNQASVAKGVHAIDKLRAEGVQLVKLFALEHGLRGEAGEGEKIGDSVDEKTGLPILSLYGDNRKPTPEQLAGVDVIVFDIQDVGVRFFTYISSLGLIMEAAAEKKIPVVVLDRPNPNGDYVEGPVLKPEHRSFVGAYPIPLVYGLTIGELAKMIQGEGWQRVSDLRLHVVAMRGYSHGLAVPLERNPSPNLREPKAIRAYPSLALFEATIISVGRGTEQPFLQFGLPGGGELGTHKFTPRAKEGAKVPPLYNGQLCEGQELFSRTLKEIPRFTTDLFTQALSKVKKRPFVTNERHLELLVGDSAVVRDILAGKPYREIRKRFQSEVGEFVKKRKAYLLY